MAGPPFGLTPQGFNLKPLTLIRTEIDDALKAAFGNSIGSNSDGSIPNDTVFGQFSAIMAEREALIWELDEAVYASADPDKAQDAAQDALAAITGSIRRGARASRVLETLTGDAGAILDAGRVIAVITVNTRFATEVQVTLIAQIVWLASTAYVVGDRRTNSSRVYLCTVAGTSGLTGPTGTGSAIVDGTVTWRHLGEGTASADVFASAETAGPFAALAGTLTEIKTPVSGWKGAVNILDAVIGALRETSAAFRIRRENELEAEGEATVNAIRAKVLRVGLNTPNPVVACTVFENTTLVTNVDGLPGKSVEALVLGGDDQEIRVAVFSKAGGIETFGNVSGTVIDTAGNSHVVKFSRATEKLIWVELDIIKNPGAFPLDGVDQIKLAILMATAFPLYSFGKDATAWGVSSPIDSVSGILDVTAVRIGLTSGPTGSATIPIGPREIAKFDSTRIAVVVTDGIP